jgi:hypothetical protein
MERDIPDMGFPARWKDPGQWRSYAEAVQDGEPDEEGEDD